MNNKTILKGLSYKYLNLLTTTDWLKKISIEKI